MNLNQLNEIINGTIQLNCTACHEYTSVFASDLMSDVLRYFMENTILITGLCTLQAIRTAEISNISCIIFARGKRVTDEMIQLAKTNNISIIESELSVFEVAGKLYQNGMKPVCK